MSGPTVLLAVGLAVPAIGFLAALVARLVLGRRRPPVLSLAAATLCGIVGSAVGATAVSVIVGGSLRDNPILVVAGGLVATLIVLTLAEQIAARRVDRPLIVTDLIAAGESDGVEFKSSARRNLRTGERDPRMELVVATTVAGFLNGRGGALLIGVADDGKVLGLEHDYTLMRRPDRDNYELWLRDLLSGTLGAAAAESVRIQFASVGDQDVCVVQAPAAQQPVFLRPPKQQHTELVVRIGNSTRQLDARDALDYAARRWSRRSLIRRRDTRRYGRESLERDAEEIAS